MAESLTWILASAVVGSLMGSFVCLMMDRLPQGVSLFYPESKCPRCGVSLRRMDIFPLVGWCRLKGKCRACRQPISWHYPLIELAFGLAFGLTAWWWTT